MKRQLSCSTPLLLSSGHQVHGLHLEPSRTYSIEASSAHRLGPFTNLLASVHARVAADLQSGRHCCGLFCSSRFGPPSKCLARERCVANRERSAAQSLRRRATALAQSAQAENCEST